MVLILQNEINNYCRTSKFDIEVYINLNNILSIKYSPLSSQQDFDSTTDLCFYITAASERRILPLRAEMLKFLASHSSCKKFGSSPSELWQVDKPR